MYLRQCGGGKVNRRDCQRGITRGLRIGCEIVEHRMHGRSDLRRRCEQAQVGIEARGRGIVIAGADVDVAPRHAVGIVADQQAKFAVGLQTHQPVIDLYAFVFQCARPLDVRCLVKTCGQLQHGCDFLLRGRRRDQRSHDRGFPVGPVDCLLQRDHAGITGRTLNEIDNRVKRIVGMMEQDVALAQFGEDVVCVRRETQFPRNQRTVLQSRPLNFIKIEKP